MLFISQTLSFHFLARIFFFANAFEWTTAKPSASEGRYTANELNNATSFLTISKHAHIYYTHLVYMYIQWAHLDLVLHIYSQNWPTFVDFPFLRCGLQEKKLTIVIHYIYMYINDAVLYVYIYLIYIFRLLLKWSSNLAEELCHQQQELIVIKKIKIDINVYLDIPFL